MKPFQLLSYALILLPLSCKTMELPTRYTKNNTIILNAECKPKSKPELCQTILDKDHEKIKNLISANANLEETDEYGITPLCYAVQMDDVVAASLLLENGVNITKLNTLKQDGIIVEEFTALHIAVVQNKEKFVELFLSKGADVNSDDKYQETPLHIAARNGNEKIIKLLFDYKANPFIKNKDKMIPLECALLSNKKIAPSTIKLLIHARDEEKNNTILHFIAEKNLYSQISFLKKFTQIESLINEKNDEGNTPLLLCLLTNKDKHTFQTVYEFIRNGANITKKNKDEQNALHISCIIDDPTITQLIMDGVIKDIANKNTLTLPENPNERTNFICKLMKIHYKRSIRQSLFIHDLRLFINSILKDSDECLYTPLHLSTICNTESVAKLLIKFGARVNATDKEKQTPLYHAIENLNTGLIKELLNHGALVNLVNKSGNTPFDVLIEILDELIDEKIKKNDFIEAEKIAKNGKDIVQLLLKANASPHVENKHRGSVINIALDQYNALNNTSILAESPYCMNTSSEEEKNKRLAELIILLKLEDIYLEPIRTFIPEK